MPEILDPAAWDSHVAADGSRRVRKAVQPQKLDRLTYSVTESAEIIGCSVSTIRRMIDRGELETVRTFQRNVMHSGRVFVTRASLEAFVAGVKLVNHD